LPDGCVFIGKDQLFAGSDYYAAVPGAVQLRQLSRDFQLLEIPQGGTPSSDGLPGCGLDRGDLWDKALELLSQGQRPILPEEAPSEALFCTCIRALAAAPMDQHEDSYRHYRRLLASCPKRLDFQTFAGFHAFQLGQFQEAEDLWLGVVPTNSMASAFLGYLYLQNKQYESAAEHFGVAAELEPEQPLHRQRQQLALGFVNKM